MCISPSLYLCMCVSLYMSAPLSLHVLVSQDSDGVPAAVPTTQVLFPPPAAWAVLPSSPPSDPPADSDAPLMLCRRDDSLSAGKYF
mmetsp:Transcript_43203/g.77418  ORF Transcript_43203/g.77418 Transcript_43203/m.77418 type:complete len:86 (+) Transcript_43203:124-381(+)